MMEGIGAIGAPGIVSVPDAKRAAGPGNSFRDLLQGSIDRVNQLQLEADRTLERVSGGAAAPEELFAATRKAQIALESLMQIRDKLAGALEEIQRMRV
jgi:flagellar hook-basal body complex protein FliE